MATKSRWIQKALKGKHPGALSRQLGIPIEKDIPITLLNKIIEAKAGHTIRNPTKTGKRIIKVTKKLEERAIFARTVKGFLRKK